MTITSPDVGGYFGTIQGALSGILPAQWLGPVSIVLAIIVYIILLAIIFSVFAYVFGWVERKLMARVQSRHGPTYVGKWGFLQNLADLVKLLAKENIVPSTADKPLFQAGIPLLLATFVLMLVFIPLTNGFVGIGSSFGLIFVFMLLSLTPLLVFITGWASGNKFSSIAAQRSVVMMLSYELPIILILVAVAYIANGYSFSSIVGAQSHFWFVIVMPIGFIVFFITLLGELDRPPFDMREADSELIAGWLTDVSGPYYGLLLFVDYTRMFVGSLLIAIIFFGGWLGPAIIPQFAWLMLKVVIISVFIILVRATTVRMRIDRLLRIGWTYLMPMAVVNLLLTFILISAYPLL